MTFILQPGQLTLANLHEIMQDHTQLKLADSAMDRIKQSEKLIHQIIADQKTVYGINTGFGMLAHTRIEEADLISLQRKIVLSHAAGVGEHLPDDVVRLMLALKINSLACGYSGVQLATIQALIALFNAQVYPCVPCKGSVGASGDLAPLAHLSALLLGVGEARHEGKIIAAEAALKIAGLKPLTLGPKEGLALLNGTQASTALALCGLFAAEKCFVAAIIAGAMSVDAACGSDVPFDARIHAARGHITQIDAAAYTRLFLKDSPMRESHRDCEKVQDPYSLRCQPQVMGACLAQIRYAAQILLTEANGVSDNPLVFAEDGAILSGGNFHAEPVGMAADSLALAIAEIGALSERRIALLVDPHFNGGLPAFLVPNPGLNSGFMIAQVTAAALASENKCLAFPSSVDSLPTSANQEDHVSMATYAARRLLTMAKNTAGIVAVELLAACQGIDLRRPLKTSVALEKIHAMVRSQVDFYAEDRYFAPDIDKVIQLIQSGELNTATPLHIIN